MWFSQQLTYKVEPPCVPRHAENHDTAITMNLQSPSCPQRFTVSAHNSTAIIVLCASALTLFYMGSYYMEGGGSKSPQLKSIKMIQTW